MVAGHILWQPLLGLLLGVAGVVGDGDGSAWRMLQDSSTKGRFPSRFQREPPQSPSYMVDNTNNTHGTAPINGKYNGPVWQNSGSFENYMQKLEKKKAAGLVPNSTLERRQDSSYWLPELAPLGVAPHAPSAYRFYRDVTEWGADPTGEEDASEAINAAVMDGERCGEDCGNTFVLGAVVYFPPGEYKICTPVIQYYYTQFIGHATDRPVIKGCDNFTGIALFDVDPYVPGGQQPDGSALNWYINQNQFFRQIRNFVFDMRDMPSSTGENGQALVPTGIHWQVSQACSLQNLLFRMPEAKDDEDVTHVGIFTENGSGGFVSDLEFEGGAVGWQVGSQQYTATSLKFTNCVTSVQMIWDWGFNWQKIEINGGSIAFNISGRGGIDGKGVSSISIIDSEINDVPIGILTNNDPIAAPNIVIDNTEFNNVGAIVQVQDSGEVLLDDGDEKIDLWTHGRRYSGKGDKGEWYTGFHDDRVPRPRSLLDRKGKLFTRLRPQYEKLEVSDFLIATEHGCSNDATGDNTDAINDFLKKAVKRKKVAYFPGGIYPVYGTVNVPVGSRIHGASWSQIQARGDYFSDMDNPKVVIRAGEPGDKGVLEIVDMLFTVKGPTAGAIMVEWNVRQSKQGSCGMWDTHIRIGGGIGTDLDVDNCPKFSYSPKECSCVAMLLHITKSGSGYFENNWYWLADHDNDMSLWKVDSSSSQISLFGGRGILIESQGPTWMYGTGSEHTILYQYQTHKAKDVYMGHIQTESPYYQPEPASPGPYGSSLGTFPADPEFEEGQLAWGVRIIDSENVTVQAGGLYSWFNNYTQQCLMTEDCQGKIMEVTGSKDVALYNMFVKASEEILSHPDGYAILQKDNQQGYISQVSVILPEDEDPAEEPEVVFLGTGVYETPTAACNSPCVMVFAPSPLGSTTTITVGAYTTSLVVGTKTTTVTVTPPAITTDRIPISNINITGSVTEGQILTTRTSITFDGYPVTLTFESGDDRFTTTRTLTLPPWPAIESGPPDQWGNLTHGTSRPPTSTTTTDEDELPPPPTSVEPFPEDPTDEPLPTYIDYPPVDVEPVYEQMDAQCEDGECPPEDDDDENENVVVVSCDELWFFRLCIKVDGLRVRGWRFRWPKGIIGPGPPPGLPKIPGWTITWPPPGPPPPPWPRITVGPGPGMKLPDEPPTCDDNLVSVPYELRTVSYSTTLSSGTPVTVSSRTVIETAWATGCPDPEVTTTDVCAIGRRTAAPPPPEQSTPVDHQVGGHEDESELSARAVDKLWEKDYECAGNPVDVIIYVRALFRTVTPGDQAQVRERLEYDKKTFGLEYEAFEHDSVGLVFFYAWNMPETLRVKFEQMPGVAHAYTWVKEAQGEVGEDDEDNEQNFNVAAEKRAPIEPRRGIHDWSGSQISFPPGNSAWEYDGVQVDGSNTYEYYRDDTQGEGQVIYLLENGALPHPELTPSNVYFFPHRNRAIGIGEARASHGTAIVKRIVGKRLGVARKAVVWTFPGQHTRGRKGIAPKEVVLIALLRIIQHVADNSNQGKCVVNMSFGAVEAVVRIMPAFGRQYLRLLDHLTTEMNCVLVNSMSGVTPKAAIYSSDLIPQKWFLNGQLPNMLVVSSSGKHGKRSTQALPWAENSQDPFRGAFFAPGLELGLPNKTDHWNTLVPGGPSHSAAYVSGLVAYLRGLNSPWKDDLRSPANVFKLVRHLSRQIKVRRNGQDCIGPFDCIYNEYEQSNYNPRIVWNGNDGKQSCLVPHDNPSELCRQVFASIPRPGTWHAWNPNDPGSEKGIEWNQGEPQATCTESCGTLCEGFYCVPQPTGSPPDYNDPANDDEDEPDPGPDFSHIPPCFFGRFVVHTEVHAAVGTPRSIAMSYIGYGNISTAICGGGTWCEDNIRYEAIDYCGTSELGCGDSYAASITNKELYDAREPWIGVKFQADTLPKGREVYLELPLLKINEEVSECPITTGLNGQMCYTMLYGGYIQDKDNCRGEESRVIDLAVEGFKQNNIPKLSRREAATCHKKNC